jgi:hypothetical protein
MILLLFYFSHLVLNPLYNETTKNASAECEVVQFYEIITPEQGTKFLTKSGEVQEATFILKPVRIDEGTYEVEITRKAPNLYQISQARDIKLTKYCIETKYCQEFANYTKAIFKVESNFGQSKGRLIFK